MPLRFETFFQFACMTILLSITHTPTMANNQFETSLVYVHNMFTTNVAIEKHAIHSVNVSSTWECFRHCAKHCDCVTFQVTGNSCELLDTDQNGAAGNLVTRPGTLVFSMQQSSPKGNGSCLNGCCQSKPCLHGGTCVEKCNDVRERYTCACPKYYHGRRCEIFHPRVKSCQAYMKLKPGSHSDVYNLNDTIQTYCDFDSEAGKAWTLIESFSLANKAFYQSQPFYHDFPQNENTFNWENFRVSYQAMVNIRDNSTHWRVTCDFPSGLTFTDYARASLQDTDILTFINQDRCQRYEFISVRGINCSSCNGMLVQHDSQHMHTDAYWSGINGCQWDPGAGAVMHEDNFGFYGTVNPQHKCTQNSLSTTQWWLGSEI